MNSEVPMHRTTRRTALVGAAVLLTGLVAQPAGAAPTWIRPPVPVSDVTLDSFWQQVDSNARGDTMVVWGTNMEGFAQAVWRPAGGPWGEPFTLSDPTHFTQESYVSVDDARHSTVIWRDAETSPSVIMARSRAANGTWDTATPLSGAGAAFHARIAGDGDRTAVAWYESVPMTSDSLIQVATRKRGGEWSTKTISPAKVQYDPEVGMGDGLVAVAWRDTSSGSSVLTASVRSRSGVWGEPKPLSPTGSAQDHAIAVDRQGRVTVIWRLYDGATSFVVQTRTRSASGSWGPVKNVSAEDGPRALPDIAVDAAGTLTAVWVEQAPPFNIATASVRPLGEAWSEPKPLSDPGEDAWNPDVAAGPSGRAVITWSQVSSTETRDTVWATTRKGAHSFRAPTRVAPLAEENTTQPRVAMDGAGDAVVVSRRLVDATYVIAATPYDANAPRIVRFNVPARGPVGTRLTFRSKVVDSWSAVLSKVWSFGDGATALGGKVHHKYKRPGTYVVKLITTDAVGNTRTRKTTITIRR
jgi:hypothetical protein